MSGVSKSLRGSDLAANGPNPIEGEPLIKVSALDHVHLYVADPVAAAEWYNRILGLQAMGISARLTDGVYMATARGQYCATIFRGKPPSDGDHTTAFRVPGTVFIRFGEGLAEAEIPGRDGQGLTAADAVDHDLAYSFYFQDPDGNHLEITTYDHAIAREWHKRVLGQAT